MVTEEESMCPVCIASGALMVGGVVSSGGLTALAAKLVQVRTKSKNASSVKAKTKEK
jgi:hypothetical protein